MNTFKTTSGQDFTVDYASALPTGYGHKKITVQVIDENGNSKDFSATTSNMPNYDEATNLEGQEKYEALFEIIEHQVEDEISEWIQENN